MFADLHVHTTNSDGKFLPPTEDQSKLIEKAKENNLRAIAITDHDTFLDDLPSVTVINNVDVINGIELRVRVPEADERVDLLGYGINPSKKEQLNHLTDKMLEERWNRADKVINNIKNQTGVKLDIELSRSEPIGRPHIARAVVDNEKLQYETEQEVFDQLIGSNCDAYEKRNIPTISYGIRILKECCNFVSLAHPYRYNNIREVLKYASEIDGIEYYYPYDETPIDYDEVECAIKWFQDVIKTGGSDVHEKQTLGTSGLTEQEYNQFIRNMDAQYYSAHQ